MSDVTAEEIRAELARAQSFWHGFGFPKASAAATTMLATVLATVRKEARREALKDVERRFLDTGYSTASDAVKAIRALMEPT